MKFHIDVDVSADELRKLFGFPDLDGLQQRMLEQIQAKIEEGVEGYDPLDLMQPYLKGSLAGMDLMRRLFAAGLDGASGGKGKTGSAP
jgi:hypothetical protein